MRYDLYLVRPDGDPSAAAARAAAVLEGDADPGPLRPEAEGWKQGLAATLTELDPRLQVLPLDFAALAELSGLDEAEARRRNRQLELVGPDDGSGVEVTLLDDAAVVSLPRGLTRDRAARAWRETWSLLEVLARCGGLAVWDPQLRRPLALGTDIGAAMDEYDGGAGRAKAPGALLAGAASAASRPWWRFW